MTNITKYHIHTDVAFQPLELIDVPSLVSSCKDKWHNQTLTQVNDCVVRLGVLEGEFHWHKHDLEDEFFYVIDGELTIELEGKTVKLHPKQGFNVPRGVMHKTAAPKKTVVLMIEAASVVPTGDR
jgi:mannose-6-phosphate isomerase-like protein (cupin superfamily)